MRSIHFQRAKMVSCFGSRLTIYMYIKHAHNIHKCIMFRYFSINSIIQRASISQCLHTHTNMFLTICYPSVICSVEFTSKHICFYSQNCEIFQVLFMCAKVCEQAKWIAEMGYNKYQDYIFIKLIYFPFNLDRISHQDCIQLFWFDYQLAYT